MDMRWSYLWEKCYQGLLMLVADASLDKRLSWARMYLLRLQAEDLPDTEEGRQLLVRIEAVIGETHHVDSENVRQTLGELLSVCLAGIELSEVRGIFPSGQAPSDMEEEDIEEGSL